MDAPLVSVFILTYNHKDFISKAVESVLSQKTDFDFEVVIGDDFSSDGTREILSGLASVNPSKIVLNLRSERGKGTIGHENFITTYEKCRGKYIAFLDGDDHWTDDAKLQSQVDFLEKNEDFILCHHNCTSAESQSLNLKKKFNKNNKIVGFYESCQITAPFMSSVLLRKDAIDYLDLRYWLGDLELGDFALWALANLKGKSYYIDKEMSFYRVSTSGVTMHLGYEVQTRNRIKFAEKLLKSDLIFDRKFINRLLCRYYFQSAGINFMKREFKRFFKEMLASVGNCRKGISLKSRSYEWIDRLKWKHLVRIFVIRIAGAFKSR